MSISNNIENFLRTEPHCSFFAGGAVFGGVSGFLDESLGKWVRPKALVHLIKGSYAGYFAFTLKKGLMASQETPGLKTLTPNSGTACFIAGFVFGDLMGANLARDVKNAGRAAFAALTQTIRDIRDLVNTASLLQPAIS